MGETMYGYDGVLDFRNLGSEAATVIASGSEYLPAGVSLHSDFMGIEYAGKDKGRGMIQFPIRLARIVGYATGEVECRIEPEDEDVSFEYYTIDGGLLYRQPAKIVRGSKEVATLEILGE